MALRVAFLINDLQLSGGVGVVLEHARGLAARDDFDVTLVLAREQEDAAWRYEQLGDASVVDLATAREGDYDIAVATWWATTYALFSLRAQRYAYFVQSLEDRFYNQHEAERTPAGLTLDLPVAFITEATWIAESISELHPAAQVHVVRNGIDKSVFASPGAPSPSDGPLRVLVEGPLTSWFKHVPDALRAAARMTEPARVTLVSGEHAHAKGLPYDRIVGPLTHREMADEYAQTDVVLKLSSVEGMFGPPLEGMHMGATCVVTPVSGYDEYVRHGVNGLLCDWDDPRGTTRQLDLLARDRELLGQLRSAALATAREWPSWAQQTEAMASALHAIADGPPPDALAAAGAMLADVRSATELHRMHLMQRQEYAVGHGRWERIKGLPLIAPVARWWSQPSTQTRFGPRIRGLLRKLLGRG
jgi:O-antigen biosynthesis protein